MALSPKLSRKQIASVVYHAKYDYPLTAEELKKWRANFEFDGKTPNQKIKTRFQSGNDYFFAGDGKSIDRRLKREKYSAKKLVIAKKAANFLHYFPTIQFVGITGSLAMANADLDSDIDLMIITSNGTLWTTRGIVLLILALFGFKLRKAGDKNERDKLCLNLWLDETDLKWKQKNAFTAHEIVQIVPLVNKNQTFERFLWANKWVNDFWPNGVQPRPKENKNKKHINNFFNVFSYQLQYLYMKKKMTNEIISITRAQFHPSK